MQKNPMDNAKCKKLRADGAPNSSNTRGLNPTNSKTRAKNGLHWLNHAKTGFAGRNSQDTTGLLEGKLTRAPNPHHNNRTE